MTQTTDEHNFEPGFYVIGIFDVLGQRSRLVEPITFPPRTDDETEAVVRNLRDTAIAVDRFRRLFRGQFDERRVVLAEEVSQVPASHRAQVEAALGWNLVDWGWSDTWCVAVRLEAGSGATGAAAMMIGVRRLLEAAAATWLFSMATGIPIRGGVEIGQAVGMREGDIYGQALVEAHRLESNVAAGPRIVLGEDLVAALQEARRDADDRYQGAAELAAHCCFLLRRDPSDWRATVDVLGSWAQPGGPSHNPFLQEAFNRAHEYVRAELRRHESTGCEKLAARYRALLAYFDERAPAWESSAPPAATPAGEESPGSGEQATPPGATSARSSSSAGTERRRRGRSGAPLPTGSDSARETQTMVFERDERTAERDWEVGQNVSEVDRNGLYTELGGEPEGEHSLIEVVREGSESTDPRRWRVT